MIVIVYKGFTLLNEDHVTSNAETMTPSIYVITYYIIYLSIK